MVLCYKHDSESLDSSSFITPSVTIQMIDGLLKTSINDGNCYTKYKHITGGLILQNRKAKQNISNLCEMKVSAFSETVNLSSLTTLKQFKTYFKLTLFIMLFCCAHLCSNKTVV